MKMVKESKKKIAVRKQKIQRMKQTNINQKEKKSGVAK